MVAGLSHRDLYNSSFVLQSTSPLADTYPLMITAGGCTHTEATDLNVTAVSVVADPHVTTHRPATTSSPPTVAVQQLSCSWLIPGDGSIPLGSYQVNAQVCVWAAPPDAASATTTTATVSKRGGHATRDTLVPLCFNHASSPIVLTASKPTTSPNNDSWWTSVRNLPIIIAVPVSLVVRHWGSRHHGMRVWVSICACVCVNVCVRSFGPHVDALHHSTGISVRWLADLVVHAAVAISLATHRR